MERPSVAVHLGKMERKDKGFHRTEPGKPYFASTALTERGQKGLRCWKLLLNSWLGDALAANSTVVLPAHRTKHFAIRLSCGEIRCSCGVPEEIIQVHWPPIYGLDHGI